MGYSVGLAVRQLTVPGSGAAPLTVLGTITSRYAEAIEDYLANGSVPQGLEVFVPSFDDSGVVTWLGPFAYAPESEPVQFGDLNRATHHGPILAQGPNVVVGIGVTAAIPICQLRSATVTATVVNFTEFQ